MIASILLASAAFAAPVNASAADAAGSLNARPIVGLLGEPLGSSDNFPQAVGGNYSNPFELTSIDLQQRGVYRITLHNTGTGWEEMFLLGIPAPTTDPKPLLVAFHGYSSTPNSILYQTKYLENARSMGWYAMAPMGAHKYNHGVDYAMDNIEYAIQWVFDHVNIDPDRIYGVGFSMGGGVAAAYAARHQDPTKPRLAAIVNHTGTVSMRDTYNNVTHHALLEDPAMFGGSPDEFPFAYAKASAIDYDMYTDLTDQTTDFARNLKYTPVYQWAVAGDPQSHLVNQAGKLHSQIQSRGGDSTFDIGLGSVHTWSSLRERAVLEFLGSHTRQDPAPGTKVKTLVHDDGRFYHFDVEQAQPGQFSSFEWKVLGGLNRLYLERVDNLSRMTVDVSTAGLRAEDPVEVVLWAPGGTQLQIELNGFPTAPTNVTRDSVATVGWVYDAEHECILITEDDPSIYRLWTIEP